MSLALLQLILEVHFHQLKVSLGLCMTLVELLLVQIARCKEVV